MNRNDRETMPRRSTRGFIQAKRRAGPLPASTRGASSARACFEPLEARRVLAAVSWDAGGGDGLWSNPLNWSADVLPTPRDDVAIDYASNRRVIAADIPVIRVKSLRVNEALIVNRGSVLNVDGAFDLDAQAALRINGLVNWVAGVWDSEDPVSVNVRGVLNIGGSAEPGTGIVTLESDLDNRGRISWRGGDVALGGVLTNYPRKAIGVASPMTLSGPGEVVNHALLRRGGALDTTTTITAGFTSDSRVHVLRGTLALGQIGSPGLTTISGEARAVYTGTALRVAGSSTTRDASFIGRGQVRFTTGTHGFAGANEFGFGGAAFTDGAVVRIAPEGAEFGGSILFDDATIVLDGDLDVTHGVSGNWQAGRVVELRDAALTGGSVATVRGTHTALVLGDARVDASLVVEAGRFEPGGGPGVASGLVVGPEGRLTARAPATSGGFAVAPGGVVVVDHDWRIQSDVLGVGAGAGTIVIRASVHFSVDPNQGPGPISVEPRLDMEQRSGWTVRVSADAAIVDLVGGSVHLAPDPVTGRHTLSGGAWGTANGGQLLFPTPVEVIGADASISMSEAGRIPALEHLVENHGLLGLSGDVVFSTLGETIANHGVITTGYGDVVITTPIENHEGASIDVSPTFVAGRATIYGALDAEGRFINRGTIRGEVTMRLEHGASPGTMVNRGIVDATSEPMTILGSFRNAPDGILLLSAAVGVDKLTVQGVVTYGGTLRINREFQAGYGPYLGTPIIAQSHTGTFSEVVNAYPASHLKFAHWYDSAGAFVAQYSRS